MSEKLSELVLLHFTHLLPPFSFLKGTEKSAKSHMQVFGPTETGTKELFVSCGVVRGLWRESHGFQGGTEGCKSLPTNYKGGTIKN